MAKAETFPRYFKSAQEAQDYCEHGCKVNYDGCAKTCKLRETYGIPPFSNKYPR